MWVEVKENVGRVRMWGRCEKVCWGVGEGVESVLG